MAEFLLMTTVAIGGVGVFLAMPKGRAAAGKAPLIILCAAMALLLTFALSPGGSGGTADRAGAAIQSSAVAPGGWFAIFATIALAGAVRVITHRRAVYSALYFVLVIVAVSGLLVLMQAEFLAVALMVIYAGAILVTYVFVIMLAQQSGESGYDHEAREPLAATLAGFLLLAMIGRMLIGGGGSFPAARQQTDAAIRATEGTGSVVLVGTELLTKYAVGVELAGVLLLAAMIGAIVIARRRAEEGAFE